MVKKRSNLVEKNKFFFGKKVEISLKKIILKLGQKSWEKIFFLFFGQKTWNKKLFFFLVQKSWNFVEKKNFLFGQKSWKKKYFF